MSGTSDDASQDQREDLLLRPENMQLLSTPHVEHLFSGEGLLTVLVLLPVANLLRWAKRRLRGLA